jgi:hypothetical protein
MNRHAARGNGVGVGYASVRPEGILSNSIADLVGIVGLNLNGCPETPRICWDNREHHFWDGFQGAFEPRNVVVNAPTAEMTDDKRVATVGYYYIANLVKTSVEWRIQESDDAEIPLLWDTRISIENLSNRILRNYVHFFACYHAAATNHYWGTEGAITPCSSGGFHAVADSEQQARLQASPYHAHCERYRGEEEIHFSRYHRPVLMSACRPWFNGARHLILVQPETCAALVTWMNQARDYMIRPRNYDLGVGEMFTSRIRHLIARVENEHDLRDLWTGFEEYLSTASGGSGAQSD